jgi:hypothetical protein
MEARAADPSTLRIAQAGARSTLQFGALAAAASAGAQIGANLVRAANESVAGRARLRLEIASQMHRRALAGRYVLLPFSNRLCSGLLVVDLENGHWAEVPLSPSEGFLRTFMYFDMTLAAVTPVGGGWLVAKGIGFERDAWTPDDAFYAVTTARRSMFGIRMADLTFRPPERHATTALHARAEL